MNCRSEHTRPGTTFVNELLYPIPVSDTAISTICRLIELENIGPKCSGTETILFSDSQVECRARNNKPRLVQQVPTLPIFSDKKNNP
jgi:hypothetical protein